MEGGGKGCLDSKSDVYYTQLGEWTLSTWEVGGESKN